MPLYSPPRAPRARGRPLSRLALKSLAAAWPSACAIGFVVPLLDGDVLSGRAALRMAGAGLAFCVLFALLVFVAMELPREVRVPLSALLGLALGAAFFLWITAGLGWPPEWPLVGACSVLFGAIFTRFAWSRGSSKSR